MLTESQGKLEKDREKSGNSLFRIQQTPCNPPKMLEATESINMTSLPHTRDYIGHKIEKIYNSYNGL